MWWSLESEARELEVAGGERQWSLVSQCPGCKTVATAMSFIFRYQKINTYWTYNRDYGDFVTLKTLPTPLGIKRDVMYECMYELTISRLGRN